MNDKIKKLKNNKKPSNLDSLAVLSIFYLNHKYQIKTLDDEKWILNLVRLLAINDSNFLATLFEHFFHDQLLT